MLQGSGIAVPISMLLLTGLYVLFAAKKPWLATMVALISLGIIPFWVGTGLSGFFVSVHLVTFAAAIAGILVNGLARFRLNIADLVLAAIFLITLASVFLYFSSLSQAYVYFQWMVAYWFGRMAVTAFGFRRVFSVIAVVFPLVAVLMVFESLTHINLWQTYMALNNSEFHEYASQQVRGGVVRGEGPFGHSIAAGSALAVMAVLTLDARMRTWVRILVLAVLGTGILVTVSRISLVTVVLGVVLTIVLARTNLTRTAKWVIFGMLAAVGTASYTVLSEVFAESGAEASNSASYRVWLLELVGTVQPIGYASSFNRSTSGFASFGGFRSIDSAVLFYALTNGWVPTIILLVLMAAAVVQLVRGRGGVATAVLVAQLPALFSVALITSYSSVFWFSAGIAVTEMVSKRGLAVNFLRLKEEQQLFERLRLATLMRRWKLIVVFALVGAGAAFAVSAATTPLYRSTASLFVTLSFGNTASDMAQGTTYTSNQMSSFGVLATSPVVLDPVIEELGLDTTAVVLARSVSVSTPRDTVIIGISVANASPQRAAAVANAIAGQTATAIEDFAPHTESGSASVQVKTMAEAVPAQFQYSPNKKLDTLVGLLVGALVGVLGVLLAALLDRLVRDADSLTEVADVAHLGSLRQRDTKGGSEAVVLQEPTSSAAEEYRKLRSNLQYASMRKLPLVVVISSGSPNEGKTTVSINLATAIAESNQKVLLVDADLRKPTVAQYSQVSEGVGLSDVLVGQVSVEDAVFSLGVSGLDVLTGGSPPPNPGELLASPEMVDLVAYAKLNYDVVILDTAPVLAVADALSLAQLSAGLVLVARAGDTKKTDLARSIESVEAAGVHVLGVVINGVKASSSRSRVLRSYPSYAPISMENKGHRGVVHARREKG